MESNGHHRSDQDRTATQASSDPRAAKPSQGRRRRGYAPLFAIVLFVVLGCAVAYILHQKDSDQEKLTSDTREMAIPTVLVVHPEVGPTTVQVALPGSVQAFMETPVYARVDGYLRSWLIDIGAHVKAGQLLAEIETPEVDQELSQARASVAQAQADTDLAETTAERWKQLLENKTVAQQEYDEKKSEASSKEATFAAAEANLRRLQDLQAFQKVYAPFDGIVTARGVDKGNLISAGSGSSSRELFRIAQTTKLRVYVNVPEYLSSAVVPGTVAHLQIASSPNQKVEGTIVRTSGAIDPTSLTLLTELSVDNADGRLLPGGYAQVFFDAPVGHPPLLIPANALIFRAQGTQVGKVDASGAVHLVAIKIGRDFGTKLEVLEGVEAQDSLILNPSDSISEGQKVKIAPKEITPPGGAKA